MSEEWNQRIQVYAPPHMLNEWKREAEELNQTQSEWCRYQIEAGRRQVAALDPMTEIDDSGDDGYRNELLEKIPEDTGKEAEEIVRAVLNPIRDELNEQLMELDDEGVIGYDPVEGGYRQK